jgi:hypothetical protein
MAEEIMAKHAAIASPAKYGLRPSDAATHAFSLGFELTTYQKNESRLH